MHIAVIGGGPAGLRAAEVAAAGGATVTLYEAKPSVGRKFLVAGRGGPNLSKAEPPELFATRYEGPEMPPSFWPPLIEALPPEALRTWAAGLGVETFIASTKRVYPREMKAAPLLRRWVERLRARGVTLATRHRWLGFRGRDLLFATPQGERLVTPHASILALGGGSWPETCSDGAWVTPLREAGIEVHPLQPANCGWECTWSPSLLAAAEGQPLKSIAVSAGATQVRGELLITKYGLEGGTLYQLGPELRRQASPAITIDFKPEVTPEKLLARLGPLKRSLTYQEILQEATLRWRLSPTATILLAEPLTIGPSDAPAAEHLIQRVKSLTIPLLRPRPIAEAISSAGGIAWREVTPELMLHRLPGIFVAGEMIDWEAPTGGYLIHGAIAQGAQAARSALNYCATQAT